MNTITDEIGVLLALFKIMRQLDNLHNFIGENEVDDYLRWAAKNTAQKIYRLSNLND